MTECRSGAADTSDLSVPQHFPRSTPNKNKDQTKKKEVKSRVRETTTEGQKKRVRKKRIEKIAETNMKMGRGS
jgi:hypothetical protein